MILMRQKNHQIISRLYPKVASFYCCQFMILVSLQRESEILFFLMIVVMLRTRKAGSVTMINYLSSSFIYAKVANVILWFYADVRMGVGYSVLFVCKYLF